MPIDDYGLETAASGPSEELALLLAGGVGTVVNVAVVLVVLLLGWRWLRRRQGGPQVLYPASDATRLVLSSLHLNGALFRSSILRRLENPFIARAPEMGLDFPLIEAACRAIDRRERVYQWLIFGSALLAVVFLPMAPVFLLVALGLALYRRYTARFKDIVPYRREAYDPAKLRTLYGLPPEAPAPNDRVICYGGADPYVGLGVKAAAWGVSVDVTRTAPERDGPPDAVVAADVQAALDAAVDKLSLPDLTTSETLFVSGVESARVPQVQMDKFARPLERASPAALDAFRSRSDPRARVYRTLSITDWGGELIFNYLYRVARSGDVLSVDVVQLVAAPIGGSYRGVDLVRSLGVFGLIGWWAASVVGALVDIVAATVSVALQVNRFLAGLFGGVDARERKEIRENPAYNYGAVWSLREQVADSRLANFFQTVDVNQHQRTLDTQVFNALIDTLKRLGVDTADLKAQSTIVQQNNVTFSGQGLNVGAVAVGASARATTAAASTGAAVRSAAGRAA